MASSPFLVRPWPFDCQGCQSKVGSPATGQLGRLLEASLACVHRWPALGRRQAYVWGQSGLCFPLPTPSHLIRLNKGRSAFSLPALLHESQAVFADVCAVTFLSCLPRGRILARAGGSLGLHCCGTFTLRSPSQGVSLSLGDSGVFRAECSLGFLGFVTLRGWESPSQGLGSLTVA